MQPELDFGKRTCASLRLEVRQLPDEHGELRYGGADDSLQPWEADHIRESGSALRLLLLRRVRYWYVTNDLANHTTHDLAPRQP